MTLTREEILNQTPGHELDALIAEHIFRWRRIKGPKFDYYGPCESNDVLVPPTITSQEEAFRYMPPKGVIPFTYFVNRGWSKDISAVWNILKYMKKYTFDLFWSDKRDENEQWVCIFSPDDPESQKHYKVYSGSAPEAICKAALLAVLNL